MSIILKALKSAREESQLSSAAFAPEPASVTNPQEGFFTSSEPVISKKSIASQTAPVVPLPFKGSSFRPWHIMVAVLVVLIAFAGMYRWMTRGPETEFIPNTIEIVDSSTQVPASSVSALDAGALALQANAALKNQDWDGAVPLFKQAIQVNPSDSQLHNSLGMSLLRQFGT